MATEQDLIRSVTGEAIACLEYGNKKIEHCLSQLNDEQLWWRPRPEMNAIGNLMLHLAGNLKQWIVAGIGDAEDSRTRQAEFDERGPIPKDEISQRLTDVVQQATVVLQSASAAELLSPTRIQGFDVFKMHAMMHSVTHFQGHVQEIICLTRQQLGTDYVVQWEPQSQEEGAG